MKIEGERVLTRNDSQTEGVTFMTDNKNGIR